MTRVLLADDHQMLRQAVRRALEDSGIDVVGEAGDGDQAVMLTETLRPDVVLMDVTMPVLDGIEATRRIAATGSTSKVLVLTMHDEDALRAKALRAGAAGFLTKDCELQGSGRRRRARSPPARCCSPPRSPHAILAQFPEEPVDADDDRQHRSAHASARRKCSRPSPTVAPPPRSAASSSSA